MSESTETRTGSIKKIQQAAEDLGISLPWSDDFRPLLEPIKYGNATIPNHFAVQPMEGFDSELNGAPGDLTFRRYIRYAEGGSGMIWFEATSVNEAGRSNPHQLMITKNTVSQLKKLTDTVREHARKAFGSDHKPWLVLQATHSGRYSKPNGKANGRGIWFNPHLGGVINAYTDDELEQIRDDMIASVALSAEAGFDAVDIKACHGYLLHELLGAHTREGKYGGSLENRARLLMDVVTAAMKHQADIDTTVRLNVTDGVPYPYGFGVAENGSLDINLDEPKLLIRQLREFGVKMINLTAGIPYHSPHWVRPFNKPLRGKAPSSENPLIGVMRQIEITAELQRAFPDILLVGSGYSWLQNAIPYVAAGVLEKGWATIIGMGRNSFAYPDAVKDLMNSGEFNARKTCIACSKCTELMRGKRSTGCVVRDTEVYTRIYTDMLKVEKQDSIR